MSTRNISLPDTLKSFLDEQVSQRGYGTSSEYVRELIRQDHDRLHSRNLLLKGAGLKAVAPADKAYFESLRDRVRSGLGHQTQSRRVKFKPLVTSIAFQGREQSGLTNWDVDEARLPACGHHRRKRGRLKKWDRLPAVMQKIDCGEYRVAFAV